MKFIFVTGGVVSSLGKGLTAAVARHAARKPRPQGRAAKIRSLPQRGSRHDEPVPARRGLCARRRRGDRPRPRPLRAVHQRQADPAQQPHQRPGLSERAQQRARGQISRQDRAGDPARHRRNQEPHPSAGRKIKADVVITEIGGTTGDIEGLPFLEAIREFALEVGYNNAIFCTSPTCRSSRPPAN